MPATEGDVHLLGAVIAVFHPVLALWFYLHCARPGLVFASAPPIAFDLALACVAGIVVVDAVMFVESTFDVVAASAGRTVAFLGILLFIPLVLGFLRPSWFTRFGHRDPTAPVRFLLKWLGKERAKLDDPKRQGTGLIQLVERELEKVPEPANATLVLMSG